MHFLECSDCEVTFREKCITDILHKYNWKHSIEKDNTIKVKCMFCDKYIDLVLDDADYIETIK